MASAHALPLAEQRVLESGFSRVRDPGASGTLAFENIGHAIAYVATATAESRVLPAAAGKPVGSTLQVVFQTDGGDLTITGANDGSVILNAEGDSALFAVVRTKSGNTVTHSWKRVDIGGAAQNVKSTDATTGDIRNQYIRLAFTGDGTQGGEALRAFTNVNGNLGTAHGAHISLSYSAEAGGSETSGLGTAIRGTTHIPDIAAWAPTGTVYAGLFELFSDGAASDPAGLTELAVLALSNSGNATGRADVDTDAALIAVNGFTAASGVTNVRSSTSLVLDGGELPPNVGIRITIDGAAHYLMAVPAASWN